MTGEWLLDRRSVLRNAAATMGVALGASGAAGASGFERGDCVEVEMYAGVYENCLSGLIQFVGPGPGGRVDAVCGQAVYVDLDTGPSGWIRTGALAECTA